MTERYIYQTRRKLVIRDESLRLKTGDQFTLWYSCNRARSVDENLLTGEAEPVQRPRDRLLSNEFVEGQSCC